MSKNFDSSIIISILIGIIVLMVVYIYVNNQKNVTERTVYSEPIYNEPFYRVYHEPTMIQQPTFFTPVESNYGCIKESFGLSDYIPSNTQLNTASMPSMKASQTVSMSFNTVNPMESQSDSVSAIN